MLLLITMSWGHWKWPLWAAFLRSEGCDLKCLLVPISTHRLGCWRTTAFCFFWGFFFFKRWWSLRWHGVMEHCICGCIIFSRANQYLNSILWTGKINTRRGENINLDYFKIIYIYCCFFNFNSFWLMLRLLCFFFIIHPSAFWVWTALSDVSL